jgi:hypothetical protein
MVALAKEFAKLDWPKYPNVYVPIIDLIGDERNLPKLIKRCCQRAKRQGVPWHELVAFNIEVLQAPKYTLAWSVAVHWFDTVGEYQKPLVPALKVRTGAVWLFNV